MLGTGGQARSLRAIGRRLLSERRGRVVLTVAGVVLGVALFTGCLLTTITANRGFERFADGTRGEADVIATAPGGALRSIAAPLGGELHEEVVAPLAMLPGVREADPLLVVPTSFGGPDGITEQRINFRVAAALVGMDLDGTALYPLALEEGRFPAAGAEEIALPRGVADGLGATVGTPVVVSAPDGRHALTLVGLIDATGLGGLDRIGFTTLPTVQRLVGRDGAVTQVAIALEDGVDAAAWIDEHEDTAPAGIDLTSATDALRFYRLQLTALSGALTVLGAGLLLTAGFLIYLTLSMSVAERTRLYGTLRALGASRAQVRRVVYGEALALGAIGTTLGLVLGVGVAYALRVATQRLMSLFGGGDLVFSPWAFGAAAAVGLGVSLASALVPARRAARIDPAAAVRATAADDTTASTRRPGAIVLLVVGVALLQWHELPAVYVGMLLAGTGAVRLIPVVIRPLSGALAPVIGRCSRVGGRVAVQHLMAERTRSANTLALVMLVMAMTVAILSIYSSFTTSLDQQLETTFGESLAVESAGTFDEGFVTALEAVPGVAATTSRTRSSTVFVPGDAPDESLLVGLIDPATYFQVATLPFVEGSPADARRALATDRGVVIPTGLADRHDLRVGDEMVLQTIAGQAPFTVAGVAEMSNLPAEILVGSAAGPSVGAWGIDSVWVLPSEGLDPDVLRDRIEAELGDRTQFLVVTAEELRADTRGQIGGGINSFFVLLALAAVVGTFGLANTMAVSVTQRVREIGVLRAIGARRRHIRAMAAAEALTLVAIALALAIPLGLTLAAPLMEATRQQLGDLTVHFHVPWTIVPVMAVVAAAVAVGAAAWPARRAAHIEIDEALRFE